MRLRFPLAFVKGWAFSKPKNHPNISRKLQSQFKYLFGRKHGNEHFSFSPRHSREQNDRVFWTPMVHHKLLRSQLLALKGLRRVTGSILRIDREGIISYSKTHIMSFEWKYFHIFGDWEIWSKIWSLLDYTWELKALQLWCSAKFSR